MIWDGSHEFMTPGLVVYVTLTLYPFDAFFVVAAIQTYPDELTVM